MSGYPAGDMLTGHSTVRVFSVGANGDVGQRPFALVFLTKIASELPTI